METKTTYRIERHQLVAGTERQWSICRTATALNDQNVMSEFDDIKKNDPKTPLRVIQITETVIAKG